MRESATTSMLESSSYPGAVRARATSRLHDGYSIRMRGCFPGVTHSVEALMLQHEDRSIADGDEGRKIPRTKRCYAQRCPQVASISMLGVELMERV